MRDTLVVGELESYTFRFLDPLNTERHFLPLRLGDTPIKSSPAQFIYTAGSRRKASKTILAIYE